MLTMDEIKQRKAEGKRKWRSSLLPFIKPLFDENMPVDAIVQFLTKTYDLHISEEILYQIKFRYYKVEQRAIKNANHQKSNENNLIERDLLIEQNQESPKAKQLFAQMNATNKKTNEFDFGDDF